MINISGILAYLPVKINDLRESNIIQEAGWKPSLVLNPISYEKPFIRWIKEEKTLLLKQENFYNQVKIPVVCR
jgi:hypothetical protein